MKVIKPVIKVVLYKSTPTKAGKYPIKLRLTYDRKSKYYSFGVYSSDTAFNETVKPPVINHGSTKDNATIASQWKKAVKALETIEESGKDFTFQSFEKLYQQVTGSKKVADHVEKIITDLQAEGRFSTSRTYMDCLRSLEAYQPGLLLNQIDADFLNKYNRHLDKKLSPASRGIHLRTLRAIINSAIASKKISKDAYPFKEFKGMPSTKAKSKKAFMKKQMLEIEGYWKKLSKTDKHSRRWQSLSLFLFSYLCGGMNLEDIIRLKESDLEQGNLTYNRQKTRITSGMDEVLALHPLASEIIADFSTISDSGYLFPYLEEGLPEKTAWYRKGNLQKKINDDLVEIAKELGLPKFTMTTARHSFASVSYNQGTPIGHIADLMRHTNEKTTRNYVASLETETKKNILNSLL